VKPWPSLSRSTGFGEPCLAPRQSLLELLAKVGLPANAADRFPFRILPVANVSAIGIAQAIALEPKLIVCDEPVSALDVSIQSQVLNLLLDLQREMGLSYVFIAHNLAVVKHVLRSDRDHVPRSDRRVRRGRRNLPLTTPSVHPRAAVRDPASRSDFPQGAHRAAGRCALAHPSAQRLFHHSSVYCKPHLFM
jgi:ABC-type antimicrobial peptide transport system ATPase subunit